MTGKRRAQRLEQARREGKCLQCFDPMLKGIHTCEKMTNRLLSKSQVLRRMAQSIKEVTAPGYVPPKPEPPEDITKLTDEALKLRIFWADDPRGGESSGPLIDELWRRRRVTEEQLAKMKRNLKIYGGHCGGCPGRPCECGFQAVWMKL